MSPEDIEKRIAELQKERDQVIAQVNFILGAIAELERIKAELNKAEVKE